MVNFGEKIIERLKRFFNKEQLPVVFSPEQVESLNRFQKCSHYHPYTCGNNSRHGVLIATPQGWKCPDCDYRQNWAHDIDYDSLLDNAEQSEWFFYKAKDDESDTE